MFLFFVLYFPRPECVEAQGLLTPFLGAWTSLYGSGFHRRASRARLRSAGAFRFTVTGLGGALQYSAMQRSALQYDTGMLYATLLCCHPPPPCFNAPPYIYNIYIVYIYTSKYIGWVGVGWQRHCRTCRSLRELDNQGTYFFFCFFGGRLNWRSS